MNIQLYDTKYGKFLLNPKDTISGTLIVGYIWEREFLDVFDTYLDKNSVVVEVGSYFGDHTVYLSKLCSRVFAYEGNRKNYYHLISTLFLNDCYNVEPFNKVIGNGEFVRLASTKYEDDWPWDWENNAGGGRFVVGGIEQQTTKLDDLNLPRMDLLKIDVEGMDLRVMMGASNLISEYHPVILFELNELVTADPFSEYEEFLESKNYIIKSIGPGNYLALWREHPMKEMPSLVASQINTLLRIESRKDYELLGTIEELFTECMDTMSRKIWQTNSQNAFTVEFIKHSASRTSKILGVGIFDDPAYPFFLNRGYDIEGLDPAINYDLHTFKTSTPHKYDVIFSTSVIEHVDNDEQFIQDICELLAPDGVAVLTTDFRDSFKSGEPLPATSKRLYTELDFETRLRSVIERNNCEYVGETNWKGEPDFIYQGHNYSFATMVFRKRG